MISEVIYVCVLISSLATVNSEPPSAQYGTPLNSYGTPNYNTHGNNEDYSEPKSYEFGYQVKDDYSGNNYKRQEASDGNQVQGEYRVQLPDGRTQIVTYYADWQTGFHADVKYEGQASYPETYNNGYGGAGNNYNNHHAAPVSNQYGTPSYAGNFNGGLNLNNFNSPATSSVSIKDYSGPGTPYNAGGNNYAGYGNGQNFNGGYNLGNGFNHGGFDSYSNTGSFGNKIRPSATYGAP